MSEFQRGNRYVVIKLANLTSRQHEKLPNLLDSFASACVNSVIVESDWPEFEPVWRMIEARTKGALPQVERYGAQHLEEGRLKISEMVKSSDYDALAAQRDEGLAREAELQDAYDDAISASNELGYACMSAGDVIRHQNDELVQLKQRLAEAEELLRGVHTGDLFGPDDWETVREFLDGPGWADGEKP